MQSHVGNVSFAAIFSDVTLLFVLSDRRDGAGTRTPVNTNECRMPNCAVNTAYSSKCFLCRSVVTDRHGDMLSRSRQGKGSGPSSPSAHARRQSEGRNADSHAIKCFSRWSDTLTRFCHCPFLCLPYSVTPTSLSEACCKFRNKCQF